MDAYDGSTLLTAREKSIAGGGSKVDYTLLVGDEPMVLVDAKSPSVMKRLGDLLLQPQVIEFNWLRNEPPERKLLQKVSI